MIPRAAADAREQHSALRCAGASIVRSAMYVGVAGRGTGEEERRREEGMEEWTKEGARTAGGKATGAWVIV